MITSKRHRWNEVTKIFGNDAEEVKKVLDRIDEELPSLKMSTLSFRLCYGLVGNKAISLDRIGAQLGVARSKVVQLRDEAEKMLQDPRWREETSASDAHVVS